MKQTGLFGGDDEGDGVLRHRRKLREEEAEWCPCCQQRIRKLNPHHMDASKVGILEKVARMNIAGHPWVKLQRDQRLIRYEERKWTIQCDDVHGLRLTWFGLLTRKRIRTGLYRVTVNGLRFLRGEHRVPETILCRDGAVVDSSEEMVDVYGVRNVLLDRDYWDNYPGEQVSRWDLPSGEDDLFSNAPRA